MMGVSIEAANGMVCDDDEDEDEKRTAGDDE